MTKQIFYFGCIDRSGHALFGPGETPVRYGQLDRDFGSVGRLDGTFCPTEIGGGKFTISTRPPWTIISWWDNSVDTRPGSHSTFIFQGYDSLGEFWWDAREKFPSVFARQPMPEHGEGVFIPGLYARISELQKALAEEERELDNANQIIAEERNAKL